MKAQKKSVTFRIAPQLRKFLERVAGEERRGFSNMLNVALEEWARMKAELHPRFSRDIEESLKSGKPEAVWKG